MSREIFTRLGRALGISDPEDEVDDGTSDGEFYEEWQCRHRREERVRNAPRGIAPQRVHRLSFDESDGSTPLPFFPQDANCPLFRLLPAEIRDLIWRFTVPCGAVIHIARLRGRMAGIVCRQGDPDERVHGCWGDGNRTLPGFYSQEFLDQIPGRDGKEGGMGPTAALLTTCRRIYIEVAPLVDETNQLHFNSIESFETFRPTIPLIRWNSLRRISFTLSLWHLMFNEERYGRRFTAPPHDGESWNRTWETVSTMQSLQEVRIVLHMLVHPHSSSPEFDEQLLASIRKIPPKVQIRVVLEWDSQEWVEKKGAEVHLDNVVVVRRHLWTEKKRWPKGGQPPGWLIHSQPERPECGRRYLHPARKSSRMGVIDRLLS